MPGNTAMTPETIVTGFAAFAFIIAGGAFALLNSPLTPVMLIGGVALLTALLPMFLVIGLFIVTR